MQPGPVQSENRVNVSPMIPVGAGPGLVIKPVTGLKNVINPGPTHPAPCTGSQFGIRNGFTPRATIGTAFVPVMLAEFEGLNPSAVAEARTVRGDLFQMREKKVGRFAFCTVTVTFGFTRNAGFPLPGKLIITWVVWIVRPAMLRLPSTLWAALVAASICAAVGTDGFAGSAVVTPISTSIFAAARAAESAARWVSLRAEYSVITSIANAMIPSMLSIASTTRIIVTPRSLFFKGSWVRRRIMLIPSTLILYHGGNGDLRGAGINVGWGQQRDHAIELPLIGIEQGHVGRDHLHGRASRRNRAGEDVTAIDRQHKISCGSAGNCERPFPWSSGASRCSRRRTKSAVVDLAGLQGVRNQIANGQYRCRSRIGKIVGRLTGSHASRFARGIGNFLLEIVSVSEIEN